jgi:hypothetical protein
MLIKWGTHMFFSELWLPSFQTNSLALWGKRQGTLKVYQPNLAIYSRKFLDQLPNIHFKLYTLWEFNIAMENHHF